MSKFLNVAIALCVGAAALLTIAGLLADWYPPFDIVNNGLPYLSAGCLVLFFASFFARARRLTFATGFLAAFNSAMLLQSLPGAAHEAAAGSERFLRVATANLWRQNDGIDEVAAFLIETDADVVVFQETTRAHLAMLLLALNARYPYRLGDSGLVILSKHRIVSDGRLERPGYPEWISLMTRWAKLDVNGTEVEFAGIHLAGPFYPALQAQDIATLAEFVRSRTGPLIVAGDFNMSPWTVKLTDFTKGTGLKRYNTILPSWPLYLRGIPFLPLVPIDNIFTSPQFTAIDTGTGPRIGSDHAPIIADIALSEPVSAATK